MSDLSRRGFLRGLGMAAATPLSALAYSSAFECAWSLVSTAYVVRPPGWVAGPTLRIAAIADIHAARPWISEDRVSDIVERANAMKPDLIVLLGDYVCTHPFVSSYVPPSAWAEALRSLRAPLGTFAILGNHDWWSAALPTDPPDGARSVRAALAEARIPLLENRSIRLSKDGKAFWLIGLGDQLAFLHRPGRRWGDDDLEGSLAQVKDEAPAILLAHEPFIFRTVSQRVALTLSGHTHGGQINLPVLGPIFAPTGGHGREYIYGAYEDGDKRLVV